MSSPTISYRILLLIPPTEDSKASVPTTHPLATALLLVRSRAAEDRQTLSPSGPSAALGLEALLHFRNPRSS